MSLTGHPLSDLTAGLITTLTTSGLHDTVSAIVPQLPQNPTYPIVRVTARGTPSFSAMNAARDWRCEVELDIYSSFPGDTEARAIADDITTLLNQQPLTVDGWTVTLVSLLDLYKIEDEFVNEQMVTRWTLPFLVWIHAADD